MEIHEFVGMRFSSVVYRRNSLEFVHEDGRRFLMHHIDDCCEDVWLEDICGALFYLEGATILVAEESHPNDDPIGINRGSYTWTFYHMRTQKGTVTLRWYGTSNGYYSERVSITLLEPEERERMVV